MIQLGSLQDCTLSELASIIAKDWTNVWYSAVPYLRAMRQLDTMDDAYGCDSAESIVVYFLSNATTWRGQTAREVKKELNRRLKKR